MKRQHAAIERLKDEGKWRDVNRVATEVWSDGALRNLDQGMEHLGEGYAEPVAIELWLGIDFPLDAIDFRILAITDRGIWIDEHTKARISSPAVLIPWTSIFALHVHSEKIVKMPER